jgi:hypothetical protein
MAVSLSTFTPLHPGRRLSRSLCLIAEGAKASEARLGNSAVGVRPGRVRVGYDPVRTAARTTVESDSDPVTPGLSSRDARGAAASNSMAFGSSAARLASVSAWARGIRFRRLPTGSAPPAETGWRISSPSLIYRALSRRTAPLSSRTPAPHTLGRRRTPAGVSAPRPRISSMSSAPRWASQPVAFSWLDGRTPRT